MRPRPEAYVVPSSQVTKSERTPSLRICRVSSEGLEEKACPPSQNTVRQQRVMPASVPRARTCHRRALESREGKASVQRCPRRYIGQMLDVDKI